MVLCWKMSPLQQETLLKNHPDHCQLKIQTTFHAENIHYLCWAPTYKGELWHFFVELKKFVDRCGHQNCFEFVQGLYVKIVHGEFVV